ncbi:MAG: hypothetical protein LBN07_00215 [Christensenellaceae bacterium]|jgi:hypothetical protein|nr:hypothetical protein [Christensenellaceae bacterium]
MSALEVVLLITSVLELIIILWLVTKVINSRSKPVTKEKKGVRYTIKDNIYNKEGGVNASFVEGDIILAADEPYHVNKDGPVKPGRYTILSPQSTKKKITLKVNAVSRNHEHDSGVVFAEGDIVVAENESVILR